MTRMYALIAVSVLSILAGTAVAQEQTHQQSPNAAGQSMQRGTMPGGGADANASKDQSSQDRGVIGLALGLASDAIGAPAHLTIRHVEPYSPAYYAGVASGDQITAVGGQSLDGKNLDEAVALIRGDIGTSVKLNLNHHGESREITLTRVEPLPQRGERGRGMMGMHGGMMGGGGMMGMRGGMIGPSNEENRDTMMQSQPPNSQFRKAPRQPQQDQ